MIVSHRHRFIFLKTRKTAGTSIELSLRPQCGPDDIVTPVTEDRAAPQCGGPRNYLHDRAGWSLADRIAWQLRGDLSLKSRPAIGFFGHVRGVDLRERLPARVWRDYFKFTIERNPWDRQVSHYFWRMRRAGARKPSFGDYLRASAPLGNWEIYTERDQLIVDKVLRYETLQTDLTATAAMLGLPELPHIARAKTSHRPGTASYRDFYDDALRDLVARSYAREIDHFGWTF
jgi:hypothetical protein